MLAHWPGRLNRDSSAILAGVHGSLPIVDHWTATLTWVWRQGHELAGLDAGGALALQTATLVVGVYLILRAVFGRLAAAVLTVATVFNPATFGFVGLVGRDAWFIGSCLLGIGLAVGATRWKRRSARAIAVGGGLAAAAVATAARQNGATATIFVLAGLAVPAICSIREHGRLLALTKRPLAFGGALTLAATIAILAAIGATDRAVRDRALHPETLTYLYDLGYLTLRENRQLIPDMSYTAVLAQTPTEVRERWRPWSAFFMRADAGARGKNRRTRLVLTDREVDLISDAWRTALWNHPGDYLLGRLALWRRQAGIGYTPLDIHANEIEEGAYGQEPPAFPALSTIATDYARSWGTGDHFGNTTGGPIHHVWVYLLVCVFGLLLLLPRFDLPVRVVAAVPASAIGLQIGLFFTAPAVHWRYQLLVPYAATIVVLLAIGLAVRARRRA